MIIDRVKQASPFIAILNSIYLSYINLEAFFFENYSKSLVDNFGLTFLSILLIFFALYLISQIKENYYSFLTLSILSVFVLAFIYGLSIMIYNILKEDNNQLFETFYFIIIEIVSISFAIRKDKSKRLNKLFGLGLLWGFAIVGTFSALGYYEDYLGYNFNKDLKLVYAGIFFHLFNATFLVYMWYNRLIKVENRH
jgi:hypothetical protein